MADWEKFWKLVDRAVPAQAVRAGDSGKGIYGDYLEGQFVKEQLNQVCRECELAWRIDWDSLRLHTMKVDYRYFVAYMTSDLIITDGETEIRRPGMGVGRCMCPFDREKQEVLQTPADHQIDTVMKTALTDFIKNAAMRLGRYFGGELYFDERMAGVLGWEIASDRATQRRTGVAPSDLGSYRIRGSGWGSERRYGGMTLEEVYKDPTGYGSMAWAAGLEDASGDTKKMAQYFNQREQEEEGGVPDGTSLEEYDESVTAAADRAGMIKIDQLWVEKTEPIFEKGVATYINILLQDNIGEGKLFGHSNHFRNHLKSHFNAAKVVDLTGEKAAALVRYIESNGKDADPRWYAEPGEPTETEELFGLESFEDLLKRAAPHLPEAWQDKPLMWWKKLREQYGIGLLNAKQEKGARVLLLAVASGGIDLTNTESDTYQMFHTQMQGIVDDG